MFYTLRIPKLLLLALLASSVLFGVREEDPVEPFIRSADLTAWTAVDPGINGHPGLLRSEGLVWSYWTAPRDASWTQEDSWCPLGYAGPGEFRELATGESEDRHFKLHDYYADEGGFGLYWNIRPELELSDLARAALLVVFTVPESGRYRLAGNFSWRHWPGPGMNEGRFELWQQVDGTFQLLSAAELSAPEKFRDFIPVPWGSDPDGRLVDLSAGDRLVIRLLGARSQYRGVDIRDDGFRIERLGHPPVAMPEDPRLAIRAWQLQTLLDAEAPALRGFRQALGQGDFEGALIAFQTAFLDLAATLRPVVLPSQWLYNATDAEDVRSGRIRALVYGGDEIMDFAIGPPGEVPWNRIGLERYPLLLRDLSTMHWAAALLNPEKGAGEPEDAALWFAYWADLAERWTEQYAAMIQDPEMVELLPRESIRWPGAAPLYFGWRLGNFFSWLPLAGEALEQEGQVRPDPFDLASVLVWLASDEIPRSARILANPAGVPNQRRLLAGGLLQAGAGMRWFDGVEQGLLAAKEFIHEMARVEMLPDGGSLEQSLNYNKGLPHEIDNYLAMSANLPENLKFSPEMVGFLERAAAYRHALIQALLRPDGTPPSIGNNNPYRPFDPWPEQMEAYPLSQDLKAAFEGDATALAFTSIYFPWSGYAAQRTGWSETAAYALFQNSRPGLGHHRESALRLDVSAFGSELLVNSGAEQYGDKGNFNAYFNATVSQNSISVDGYTQLADAAEKELPYTAPIPARWHAGEQVDYMEGSYTGPYGGWNFLKDGAGTKRDVKRERTVRVEDAAHRRRVIFFREVPLWVVIDEVMSETERRFTQSWNLAPQFSPESVGIDPKALRVHASLEGQPSIELLQFAGEGVRPTYGLYHGVHDRNRVLGWVSKDSAPQAYDFQAAGDLHVEWNSAGRRWLVTVIAPSPDAASVVEAHRLGGDTRILSLRGGAELELELPSAGQDETAFRVVLRQAVTTEEGDQGQRLLAELWLAPGTVHLKETSEERHELRIPEGFFWQWNEAGQWSPVYEKPGPGAYGY